MAGRICVDASSFDTSCLDLDFDVDDWISGLDQGSGLGKGSITAPKDGTKPSRPILGAKETKRSGSVVPKEGRFPLKPVELNSITTPSAELEKNLAALGLKNLAVFGLAPFSSDVVKENQETAPKITVLTASAIPVPRESSSVEIPSSTLPVSTVKSIASSIPTIAAGPKKTPVSTAWLAPPTRVKSLGQPQRVFSAVDNDFDAEAGEEDSDSDKTVDRSVAPRKNSGSSGWNSSSSLQRSDVVPPASRPPARVKSSLVIPPFKGRPADVVRPVVTPTLGAKTTSVENLLIETAAEATKVLSDISAPGIISAPHKPHVASQDSTIRAAESSRSSSLVLAKGATHSPPIIRLDIESPTGLDLDSSSFLGTCTPRVSHIYNNVALASSQSSNGTGVLRASTNANIGPSDRVQPHTCQSPSLSTSTIGRAHASVDANLESLNSSSHSNISRASATALKSIPEVTEHDNGDTIGTNTSENAESSTVTDTSSTDSNKCYGPWRGGSEASISPPSNSGNSQNLLGVSPTYTYNNCSPSAGQASTGAFPFATVFNPSNVVEVNGTPYLRMGGCIGRGGTSEVYRVLSPDCRVLALKHVTLEHGDSGGLTAYANEIDLLKRLRGKRAIINLEDAEIDLAKGVVHMVMELGEVDLDVMLKTNININSASVCIGQATQPPTSTIPSTSSKGPGGLSPHFVRLTWQQMLVAVSAMHEQRVVHGDLKPANFVFCKGALKLIDFGIAKTINNGTVNISRETQVGTLNYMSPEAITDTGDGMLDPKTGERGSLIKLGRASDVWSLGCILYQMVYGRTPFSHIRHPLKKLQAITDPKHEISFDELADAALLETITLCLQRNASERPGIEGKGGLLQHTYLNPNSYTQRPAPQPQQPVIHKRDVRLIVEECINVTGGEPQQSIDAITRLVIRNLQKKGC